MCVELPVSCIRQWFCETSEFVMGYGLWGSQSAQMLQRQLVRSHAHRTISPLSCSVYVVRKTFRKSSNDAHKTVLLILARFSRGFVYKRNRFCMTFEPFFV